MKRKKFKKIGLGFVSIIESNDFHKKMKIAQH